MALYKTGINLLCNREIIHGEDQSFKKISFTAQLKKKYYTNSSKLRPAFYNPYRRASEPIKVALFFFELIKKIAYSIA